MKSGAKNIGRLAAVPSTTAAAIKLGAVAGDAISIIQNAHRISLGQIDPAQAAANVVKDTVAPVWQRRPALRWRPDWASAASSAS